MAPATTRYVRSRDTGGRGAWDDQQSAKGLLFRPAFCAKLSAAACCRLGQ